jgi:ABC-type nickel/cobalt efflux system permease component RcnA
MFGLDDRIAHLGAGGSLALALGVALLLGLRHATDPDHLTAVSTLIMSDRRMGPRRARLLGLAWGAGHAATLLLLGLPVVLFRKYLPAPVQHGAEVAVGVVIIALASRLLIRWRRGYFHVHPHSHGEFEHAHPHVHEHEPFAEHPHEHQHEHAEALGRTPLASFGIGLVHGAGGSAGVGILLISAIPNQTEAAFALCLFAGATAISMSVLSAAFGYALSRIELLRRVRQVVPALGMLSLMFGVYYAAGAFAGA